MKRSPLSLALIACLSVGMIPASYAKDKSAALSEKEKLSYSAGVETGRGLKEQQFDIDTAAFNQGVKDVLNGNPLRLSDEEMQHSIMTFRKNSMNQRLAEMGNMQGKNKQEGLVFLEKNKKQPGVVTLADGLQYKVLVTGKGEQPKENDVVVVHYAGKLIDGTEFDSSYKRGEPATFPVTGVIPGWTEALKLMKVGSTWELYVPADLAYGEQGAPPVIGPNQTLIFKVNLVGIKKQDS